MKKLTKIAPDWHAEAAAELNRDFVEIDALQMTARKRRAYLGLKFIYVKMKGKADGSIPHGTFKRWLKQCCTQIPYRTAARYMAEGDNIMELMGLQKCHIGTFDFPLHKLLELPPADLKPAAKKQQQMLLDIVDEKGSFQSVSQYKQMEEGPDGEWHVKVGRRKGEGGKPPRPADIDGQIKHDRDYAMRQLGLAHDALGKLGLGWLLVEDAAIDLWLGDVQKHVRCMNEWLNTPPGKRDHKEIAKLYRTL